MPLPSGITTALITFGKASSFLGTGALVEVTITPSHRVLWEPTGDYLSDFSETIVSQPGVVGSIELPHTDQPGFRNAAGAAFAGFHYVVEAVEKLGTQTRRYRKVVQVTSDITELDLDAIPVDGQVGPPGSTEAPLVTSVVGKTGAITVEDLLAAGLGGGGGTGPGTPGQDGEDGIDANVIFVDSLDELGASIPVPVRDTLIVVRQAAQ